MIYNLTPEEFQQIVDETINGLPYEFKTKLENVDILVEIWPSIEELQSIRAHPGITLFGLYKGVPKTKRGMGYSGILPDKIIIFAGPILSMAKTKEKAQRQIRQTVLHEIGHHFGMSEESIREAEKKNIF